jgi:hypothetical protein
MKSLTSLWSVLANEFAGRCSTSTTKDINTVLRRVENEGVSFLTITLPSFGKDFQYCLDQASVSPKSFLSFRKTGSCLPSFLRGFTELVFDSGTGVLLDKPDIEAIYAVRQLTLIYGKMLLPCTPEREAQAMSDYIQCDKEVKYADSILPDSMLSEFGRMGQLLFGSLFASVDSDIYNERITPKHGPGATAERLSANEKYLTRYWTERLEKVFHVGDFLYPNLRLIDGGYDALDFLEPDAEMPSRVISVPKTQKGPRIIAIEPSSVQYVQQGLLEAITTHTRSSILNEFIGSDSQEPNQLLAQKGSSDGSLATLDLSDASDRVSLKLVEELLAKNPLSREAILACRSQRASVPGGGIISLSKFASMGSALCFPIEAMVFLTIIFLSIEKEQGHRFSNISDISPYIGRVRVYGDDIIIPIEYVHTCVDLLEYFGARVGQSKSFWTGRFRESCGKEFFEGHDVSIVKARRNFPSHRQHVAEVVSLVSLRNQLYFAGCWKTVAWLDVQVQKVLKHFPNVLPTSSALGRHSFLGYQAEREDEHLHSPLVKAYVVSSVSPKDELGGPGALLKFFLKRGRDPSFDERHLERAGRPRAVYIKPRWVSPF